MRAQCRPYWRLAFASLAAVLSLPFVAASPAVAQFDDCFSGNSSLKATVSTVYAQITDSGPLGRHLNLTVLGQSPQQIVGLANDSHSLGVSSTLPLIHITYHILQPPLSRPPMFLRSTFGQTTRISAPPFVHLHHFHPQMSPISVLSLQALLLFPPLFP
jgi:hypothetical protein